MADLKARWHVSRPGAVRLVHVPKWPAQPTEPPPSARRTGTADVRWAAPRWRRGRGVMRADVDVAPSSTEPPPPTHPRPYPDPGRQFACQRRHRPPIIC